MSANELPHDSRDLLALCRANGWEVRHGNGGGVKVYNRNEKFVASFSPKSGDHRAVKNFRAQLHRAGLNPNPEKIKPKISGLNVQIEYFDPKNPKPSDTPITPPKEEVAPAKEADMAPKKPKALERGAMQRAIFAALETLDHPDGLTVQEVFDLVHHDLPGKTRDEIGQALANYTGRGHLKRVGKGRYVKAVIHSEAEPAQLPIGPVPPAGGSVATSTAQVTEQVEPVATEVTPLRMIEAIVITMEGVVVELNKLRAAVEHSEKVAKRLAKLEALLAELKE